MNKKNKKIVEIEVPLGKYQIIKNADGKAPEKDDKANKDNKEKEYEGYSEIAKTVKKLEIKKDASLSAGHTVDTTAAIAQNLVINHLTRFKKEAFAFLSRVKNRTLSQNASENFVKSMKTIYLTSPDKSHKTSLGVVEGRNPSIITPDYDDRDTYFNVYGKGARITQDANWNTKSDLIDNGINCSLDSFLIQKQLSVLQANTLPIGKAVIKSVVAGTGGSIAAGAHSVVVVEMTANAAAEYKKSNKIKLLSKTKVDYAKRDREEERNLGLGQYSDAVEVTTEANGTITVILDIKPNVFGYGVFVDGKYQGFYSRNEMVLKSLKTNTQLLSTLADEDCSVDELSGPGFLQLLHNDNQKQFCKEFAPGEYLEATPYNTELHTDEMLERAYEEHGVLFDVMFLSSDMSKVYKNILYKDISVNVNINEGGVASAVNFDMSYPHPCNESHRLQTIVLPYLPEGTVIFWSDSMPSGQDWGDIENPFQEIFSVPLHLQKFADERTIEVAWIEKSGRDMPASFCFRAFKNCSSKVR